MLAAEPVMIACGWPARSPSDPILAIHVDDPHEWGGA
jgi:hypothetical protein